MKNFWFTILLCVFGAVVLCASCAVLPQSSGVSVQSADESARPASTPDSFTVQYMDGNLTLYSGVVQKYTAATYVYPAEKAGYSFLYWAYGGNAYDFSSPVTHDITLCAVWSPTEFDINYVADGKTVKTQTCTVECVPEPPDIPQKTGYDAHWNIPDFTGEDITAVAVYEPKTYPVVFRLNGKIYARSTRVYGEQSEIIPPEEREGYRIVCEETFTGEYFAVDVRYVARTYTATCVVDGGIFASVPFTVDMPPVLPDVPEKEGFDGHWSDFEIGAHDITVYAVYVARSAEDGEAPDNQGESGGNPESGETSDNKGGEGVGGNGFDGNGGGFDDEKSGGKPDGGSESENESKPESGSASESEDSEYSAGLIFADCEGGVEVTGYTGEDTDVVIPAYYGGKAVVSVAQNAFAKNGNIVSVRVPNTVKSIGKSAFKMCAALAAVYLSEGLESIGNSAFAYCQNIAEIRLPASVREIGASAFTGIKPDAKIYLAAGSELTPDKFPQSVEVVKEY